MADNIKLYESDDGSIKLNVQLDGDAVWLASKPMTLVMAKVQAMMLKSAILAL